MILVSQHSPDESIQIIWQRTGMDLIHPNIVVEDFQSIVTEAGETDSIF